MMSYITDRRCLCICPCVVIAISTKDYPDLDCHRYLYMASLIHIGSRKNIMLVCHYSCAQNYAVTYGFKDAIFRLYNGNPLAVTWDGLLHVHMAQNWLQEVIFQCWEYHRTLSSEMICSCGWATQCLLWRVWRKCPCCNGPTLCIVQTPINMAKLNLFIYTFSKLPWSDQAAGQSDHH